MVACEPAHLGTIRDSMGEGGTEWRARVLHGEMEHAGQPIGAALY